MDRRHKRQVGHPLDTRVAEASAWAQKSCDNLVMVLHDIDPGDPRLDQDVVPVLRDDT